MQAEANMHDEYFGHVIAGIRFGNSLQQFLDTVAIAFEVAGTRQHKQVLSLVKERHGNNLFQMTPNSYTVT